MKIYETLGRAYLFAAARWREAGDAGREEEERLWMKVNAYRDFICTTGQAYLFEDYLKGVAPSPRPQVSTALEARRDSTSPRAMALLLKAFDETLEPRQKRLVKLLIAQVNFIADTGQLEVCEDWIDNRLDYAPVAIAHFATRDEAEAWLKGLAEPPSPAKILIGDEYHDMMYIRQDNARYIRHDYVIEPYLEGDVAEGIPSTVPTFETREEAERWLALHPASPFGFVSIAGEYFYAVHHRWLKRHSLHPVASTLTAWEEYKRALERDTAQEDEVVDEEEPEVVDEDE